MAHKYIYHDKYEVTEQNVAYLAALVSVSEEVRSRCHLKYRVPGTLAPSEQSSASISTHAHVHHTYQYINPHLNHHAQMQTHLQAHPNLHRHQADHQHHPQHCFGINQYHHQPGGHHYSLVPSQSLTSGPGRLSGPTLSGCGCPVAGFCTEWMSSSESLQEVGLSQTSGRSLTGDRNSKSPGWSGASQASVSETTGLVTSAGAVRVNWALAGQSLPPITLASYKPGGPSSATTIDSTQVLEGSWT
ncbi:unnamed protein product [Protopolystoma xenopodis]|uniref:Uncharacterized protein n=1 Tax=Protopolystoma xenopodis TaxID=117903 RepID=A0A448XGC8_9PLAT|nr:unnamed protein product [Protopolystoma xenopodis]